jgi:hypothetical protein
LVYYGWVPAIGEHPRDNPQLVVVRDSERTPLLATSDTDDW